MAKLERRIASATYEVQGDESDTTIVSVSGELDLSSVPGLERELEPFLAAAPKRVVFDLSSVAFMDSSGIALLLRAAERVDAIVIRKPSPAVQLIFGATGLDDVLEVEQ